LNFIIGIALVGFGVYCYLYGFDATGFESTKMLKILMPGYIGFSGLIILLIECRVGFMVNNMKFLYNYFGRGLFNIYAGVMPMTMFTNIDDTKDWSVFQIITVVVVVIMVLVGLLYIFLKVFCCAK